MKKIFIVIIIVSIIVGGGLFASYSVAIRQAKKVEQSFSGNLSPLGTRLIPFGIPGITPCWVVRSEYSDLYTGATFDVYVSLFGKVLRVPPQSKAPE